MADIDNHKYLPLLYLMIIISKIISLKDNHLHWLQAHQR